MSHGFGAARRWRGIAAISEGLSTRQAAARFGLGISTAGEGFRRYRTWTADPDEIIAAAKRGYQALESFPSSLSDLG